MHPNVCDIAAVGPRAAVPQRIGRILVNFELSDYRLTQDFDRSHLVVLQQ
jgi:hypothetical protein